ncbi:MAG: SurA N-terminal domain-containing protein [bacterium]|nr:SurA N-terminal domain-containing protein [bacterium]
MDNDTIQKESLNAEEHRQKAGKKSIKIGIKTAIIIAVVIIIGALAYVYKGLFVAATVDGSPISRLAVIQKLEKASGKSLLDSLINEKLVENEVSAKKIVVSDDEINSEIKTIENRVAAQGGTLDAALAAQGMSMDDLKKQIILQKEMEKLLADKINVTDEEVAQYIEDNKISIPEGQEAAAVGQIKNEIRNQKLNTEAQILITDLKSKAKIQYFVNY